MPDTDDSTDGFRQLFMTLMQRQSNPILELSIPFSPYTRGPDLMLPRRLAASVAGYDGKSIDASTVTVGAAGTPTRARVHREL